MHLINTYLAVVGKFVKALPFGIPEVLTAVVVAGLVVMAVVRVVVAATVVECAVVATIERSTYIAKY